MSESAPFPLAAVLGQDVLVEALLVCAVDPGVGGVLVRGERGTAKTTAVRGLAALLPADAPLVDVPLGTTLDRLVGSIDLGHALAGEAVVERGLLSRAHRGILYVDEVNLLADHLVDALLDAAATGVCRVEREAVSVVHDARFLLVGTMNAEEGDLRPQLLDRFGLGVDVTTPSDPSVRAEVVRRRLAHDADPAASCARWAAGGEALRDRIDAARRRLADVRLPERELLRITGACAQLGLDGIRGDVVCARAARVLAALDGDPEVGEDHVRRAAHLAFAHRRRRDPLDGAPAGGEDIDDAIAGSVPEPPAPAPDDGPGPPDDDRGGDDGAGGPAGDGAAPHPPAGGGVPDPQRAALRARLAPPGRGAGPAGRSGRSSGRAAGGVDHRPATREDDDHALVPSVLTAAPRAVVRAGRDGALLVLVVDTSGSMAARARLARVKGALLDVLRDAYARRDRVCVIAFRDTRAEVVAAPGTPVEQAAAAVRALPAGGRTPLAAGLRAAVDVIGREATRAPDRRAVCAVLTDGRAPDPDGTARDAAARLGRLADVHIVDTEDGAVRLGLAARIAAAADATLTSLTTTTPTPTARRAA